MADPWKPITVPLVTSVPVELRLVMLLGVTQRETSTVLPLSVSTR